LAEAGDREKGLSAAVAPVPTWTNPAQRTPEIPEIASKSVKPKFTPGSTCRDEVIAAAKAITGRKGVNDFAVKEVVDYLAENGSEYSPSTIRTHVVSRCCANAATNNGPYADFERVERGRYRLTD
jgi:hypothetical protein